LQRDPYTKDEKDAYLRALVHIAGKEGVSISVRKEE